MRNFLVLNLLLVGILACDEDHEHVGNFTLEKRSASPVEQVATTQSPVIRETTRLLTPKQVKIQARKEAQKRIREASQPKANLLSKNEPDLTSKNEDIAPKKQTILERSFPFMSNLMSHFVPGKSLVTRGEAELDKIRHLEFMNQKEKSEMKIVNQEYLQAVAEQFTDPPTLVEEPEPQKTPDKSSLAEQHAEQVKNTQNRKRGKRGRAVSVPVKLQDSASKIEDFKDPDQGVGSLSELDESIGYGNEYLAQLQNKEPEDDPLVEVGLQQIADIIQNLAGEFDQILPTLKKFKISDLASYANNLLDEIKQISPDLELYPDVLTGEKMTGSQLGGPVLRSISESKVMSQSNPLDFQEVLAILNDGFEMKMGQVIQDQTVVNSTSGLLSAIEELIEIKAILQEHLNNQQALDFQVETKYIGPDLDNFPNTTSEIPILGSNTAMNQVKKLLNQWKEKKMDTSSMSHLEDLYRSNDALGADGKLAELKQDRLDENLKDDNGSQSVICSLVVLLSVLFVFQ